MRPTGPWIESFFRGENRSASLGVHGASAVFWSGLALWALGFDHSGVIVLIDLAFASGSGLLFWRAWRRGREA